MAVVIRELLEEERDKHMTLDVIVLVIWLIAGVVTLCGERVSKFDYSMVWILLILNLIGNLGA